MVFGRFAHTTHITHTSRCTCQLNMAAGHHVILRAAVVGVQRQVANLATRHWAFAYGASAGQFGAPGKR